MYICVYLVLCEYFRVLRRGTLVVAPVKAGFVTAGALAFVRAHPLPVLQSVTYHMILVHQYIPLE